jgi:hypothetical protein
MKTNLFVILILGLSQLAYPCGKERWQVKVMHDADDFKVNMTPESATISGLIAKQPPTRNQINRKSNSRFPSELKTYKLTALLLGYKLETDEDFHIVLQDPNSKQTMVVEIPSANCGTKDDETLRGRLEQRFGKAEAKFKTLAQPVKITVIGVGFFDFLHGQKGVAKNGIELHPVLSLEF